MTSWILHYNDVSLHSATGDVSPTDMMEDKASEIHKLRDEKFEKARELRQKRGSLKLENQIVMH